MILLKDILCMHMLKLSTPTRKDYKEIVVLVNKADLVYLDIYAQKEAKEVGVGYLTKEDLISGEKTKKYFILKDKNKVLAFASFRLKNNQTVWISSLYVKVSQQRKGCGAALLSAIEDFAVKNKAKVVVLETEKKATWAVNFYLKNGYKKLSVRSFAKFPFDKVIDRKPAPNQYIMGKVVG